MPDINMKTKLKAWTRSDVEKWLLNCTFELAKYFRRNPRDVVTNERFRNVGKSEFDIQSGYYVHFRTNTLWKIMKHFIPPAIGQIMTLLFYKKGFSIK